MKTTKYFVAVVLFIFVSLQVSFSAQTPNPRQNQLPTTTNQPINHQDMEAKVKEIMGFLANSNDPELVNKMQDFLKVYSMAKDGYVNVKTSQDLMNLAMKGMVGGLDPYSNLFIGDEAQEMLKVFSDQNYSGGIGVTIGRFGKNVYITDVFEGSPAAKAGIKPGDILAKVENKDIFGMAPDQVASIVRGKEGTTVSVEIKGPRLQKPKILSLVRQKIQVASIVYRNIDVNTGYIKIRQFTEDTEPQFLKALLKANRKSSLVIDLRNNPGGLLATVINMVGDFIGPDKTVIIARSRSGNQSFTTSFAATSFKYPKKVAILINNSSASASEIMSGNMQFYKIGKLIGVRTYGKAFAQNYIDVNHPGQRPGKDTTLLMGLTIAHFLLPNGVDINSVGVQPDIEVQQPENFKAYQYLTVNDAQFQAALKYLRKK